ncbi:hypothetical protein AVEN_177786-1 [Araneus ventricosus]|uniref:Uncharacterized protein n=1 Tax=Araneus ventricosus TaxID=182803 RepID=A0A4Y2F507_ARAVE|nr:hypothetical protein AVEN_177786-1 [Araneus ventricosus]
MRFKTRLSLSASFDFQPLLCFEDVILPSFVYTVITADTVLLANPKRFAVSVTDAPLKRAPTISPLWNSDRSDISTYHRQLIEACNAGDCCGETNIFLFTLTRLQTSVAGGAAVLQV